MTHGTRTRCAARSFAAVLVVCLVGFGLTWQSDAQVTDPNANTPASVQGNV
jgi:hypothetical protein